jgi:hypothetical protein
MNLLFRERMGQMMLLGAIVMQTIRVPVDQADHQDRGVA